MFLWYLYFYVFSLCSGSKTFFSSSLLAVWLLCIDKLHRQDDCSHFFLCVTKVLRSLKLFFILLLLKKAASNAMSYSGLHRIATKWQETAKCVNKFHMRSWSQEENTFIMQQDARISFLLEQAVGSFSRGQRYCNVLMLRANLSPVHCPPGDDKANTSRCY